MKILDLYVARHVLGGFLIVLLVVAGLDMLFALVEEMKDIGGDYTLSAVVKYVMLTAPRRFYEFIPLSSLIGCLLGLGILASSSELTVMRAAGISTFGIIVSVMKPVFLIVVMALSLGEFVVPQSEQSAQSHRQVMLTGNSAISDASHVWHRDEMTFLHINAVIPDGSVRGLTRYEFNDDLTLARASFAKTARYNGQDWELSRIKETRFPDKRDSDDPAAAQLMTSELESEVWTSGLTPELLKVVMIKPTNLSMSGLLSYGDYLDEQGLASSQYRVAFWSKLLLPVAIFALVIVAVSFIFGPLRSVTLGQRLITGIIVGLAFKLSQDVLGPTSAVFGFSPLIAVAAPIVICIGLGFWLLNRAK